MRFRVVGGVFTGGENIVLTSWRVRPAYNRAVRGDEEDELVFKQE
jgi:hypothetical protein